MSYECFNCGSTNPFARFRVIRFWTVLVLTLAAVAVTVVFIRRAAELHAMEQRHKQEQPARSSGAR